MKEFTQKEVRFCEKTTELYILFVTLALSLFCFPSYESITEYKFKAFFIGTVVYIAILLLGNLELSLIGRKSDFISSVRKATRFPMVAITLYLGVCFVSYLLSEHRAFALLGGGKFDGMVSVLLYVLAFVSVAIFGKVSKKFFIGLAVVVWINFIIVLLQFCGANPLSLYPGGLNYYDAFKLYANEFLGTFGNVDILSVFFAMALPIFVSSAMNFSGRIRYLFFASIALSSFVLLICKVYTGLVGAGVAIILLAFSLKDRYKIRMFVISLFCCSLGALLALFLLRIISFVIFLSAVLLSVAFLFIKIKSRKVFLCFFCALVVLVGFIIGYAILNDMEADSGRLDIWKDAFDIFLENPLFGIGTGAYLKESSIVFRRFDEALGTTITSAVDCAHNVYINVLVNSGFFALLAYIGFIVSVFLQSKNRDFVFPVVAYLICALFSFEVCSVSAFFYVTCGLAVCNNTKNL